MYLLEPLKKKGKLIPLIAKIVINYFRKFNKILQTENILFLLSIFSSFSFSKFLIIICCTDYERFFDLVISKVFHINKVSFIEQELYFRPFY